MRMRSNASFFNVHALLFSTFFLQDIRRIYALRSRTVTTFLVFYRYSNASFFKCKRFSLVPFSFKISVKSIPCKVKRLLLSFRLYTALHHVVNIMWKGDSDAL